MARTRTRGTMVTEVPQSAFAALESTGVRIDTYYLIDRGEGEGARYALVDTEGVTRLPSNGLFHVLNDWRDAAYAVSVERIVAETVGGVQDDLADVVRTFGDRLEFNFSSARRWARRES